MKSEVTKNKLKLNTTKARMLMKKAVPAARLAGLTSAERGKRTLKPKEVR